jgi:thiol-disulfide isomerase/thioredoxin
MKIILTILLLLGNLFAYKEGEKLSPQMIKHLSLDDNKIYIVDFFASWCSSCQKELPLISHVTTKLDKNRVEIIGVDVDQKVESGIAFQERLKKEGNLNFRVINDPQNLVVSEFNPIGMPTLYYIKNQKVVAIVTGAVDEIDLKILNDLKEME